MEIEQYRTVEIKLENIQKALDFFMWMGRELWSW